MSFELKGKIVKILEEQRGIGKNGEWRRKDFVIETLDNYPRRICFSLWNDKIQLLNTEAVEIDDEVRVLFSISSREYNGKWYSDITAYHLENITRKEQEKGSTLLQQSNGSTDFDIFSTEEQSDDLPF